MFQRTLDMTKGKSEDEIKQIIVNIAGQRGMNAQQLNAMLGQFGLKL